MGWVHRRLKRKAVLWTHSGVNDRQGQPVLNAPVEIRAYYELVQTTQQDANSQSTTKLQEVWVDRDIALHSMMWLGELNDLPDTVTTALRVVEFHRTEGWGSTPERRVVLARWTGQLPTVNS